MRRQIGSLVFVSALIGGVPAASSIAAEQPIYTAQDIANAKPVATIEVEAEQLRLMLGGASGKGVLRYQGKTYPFTLKGLTAGGVGYNKVTATGDVYFLKSPADFEGTYSAITAGATIGKGAGASQYQNGKGVFIQVKSKSEGLALTLGLGGVEVKFQ
jgi:hypothetical protein